VTGLTQEKALLLELLRGKGYRDTLVLGPFGGATGTRQYTVPLYDEAGKIYLVHGRGSPCLVNLPSGREVVLVCRKHSHVQPSTLFRDRVLETLRGTYADLIEEVRALPDRA